MDRYKTISKIVVIILSISIAVLILRKVFHPVIAIWLGFLIGGFSGFPFVLLIDKMFSDPEEERRQPINPESEKIIQETDDWLIMVAYSECLHKHVNNIRNRTPTIEDLPFPPDKIEAAINRMIAKEHSQKNKTDLLCSLSYLKIFKEK
jgi:hypothetical protein